MRSLYRITTTARELWPLYLGIVLGAIATAVTALLMPFAIARATDTVVAMVAGWYAVRGRISGDMFESIDLKDGDQTPAAADDGFPVEVAGSPEAAEVTGGERS